MKIQLEVSDDNESTSEPWWILIDPGGLRSVMEGVAEHGEVPDAEEILSRIAFAVTGPFFSRKEGEDYLKRRSYEYSKDAGVWCSSGYWTSEYAQAIKSALKQGIE